MINQIKRILSSSAASFICLTLAIIGRIVFIRMFLQLGSDKVGQMVMAKNFVGGNGFTIDYSLVSDLAQRLYMPPSYWPPGYSFLLSPFLIVTRSEYVLSSFLLDALSAIVLFWYMRKILLLARFPVWLCNLFLLFQGLFIPDYLSNSPDFVGLAALVATIYYAARIAVDSKLHAKTFIWFFIFCSITFFLRYQNMPVVLLLTLSMIKYGNYRKCKHLVIAGGISFFILAGYGLFYYVYLRNQESTMYVSESKTGFYPSNLQYLHPFLISSFINIKVWTRHLTEWSSLSAGELIRLFRWINIGLLLIILVHFLNLRIKGKLRLRSIHPIWVFGGLVAVGSILVLVFLSLVKDKNVGPPMLTWTFVYTARYFAFPELLFQIFIWRWLFFELNGPVVKKILSWFFVAIMLVEVSRSFYILARRFPNLFPAYGSIIPGNSPTSYIIDFVYGTRKTGREAVVAGFDKYPAFMSALYSGSGLFNPTILNETLPKSSMPATLLLVIGKGQEQYLSNFLKRPGVQFQKESGGFYFYTYDVEPGSK